MFQSAMSGRKGAKAVAAALLLLVLFAWAGSTVRSSGAEQPKSDSRPAPELEGFKNRGPDLPVERLVITLVILIGGAGIALWLLKRFGQGKVGRLSLGLSGAHKMQLVGRLPLGGRRGLVLVRAAGRLLVLGVSEAGVQKVLERADDEDAPDAFVDALERVEAEGER